MTCEVRRNARYRPDDYADLDLLERSRCCRRLTILRASLEEAEAFVTALPAGKEGLLFLQAGHPRQPDPKDLTAYVEHADHRGGYWPSSSHIGSAMLE